MYALPSFCKRRMRMSVGPGLSFVAALLECVRLQLRRTINRNTCPGDLPSAIGGEECDHAGGIIGFADSPERPHAECKIAARFRFGKTGHIGFNYPWRNGVHTDATWPKGEASVSRGTLQHFETASRANSEK